jgi:hypothetical protein
LSSTNRRLPIRRESRMNTRSYARSSFSRMFTKLYGGHGPCT